MLIGLHVKNFAIVDRIDVEFADGMTVLTGETGAGKSILIDALGLVLGERGSSKAVRNGANRAEFSAEFDVSQLSAVRDWLASAELDEEQSCLVRRIISAEGRSRAFVNGNAVTMQQLKELGNLLIDIHGQHFHQSLTRRQVQRNLLDHFGKLAREADVTRTRWSEWRALADELEAASLNEADRASRIDLLLFQIEELERLTPDASEPAELAAEQQRLRNSGRLAEGTQLALAALSESGLGNTDAGNASALLADAQRVLTGLVEYDDALAETLEYLDAAAIQLNEASDTLQRYAATLNADPGRREWVEDRLASLKSVARKHKVEPRGLPDALLQMRAELEGLENAETRGRELEASVNAAEEAYMKAAVRLSGKRKKAALAFNVAVGDAMQGLGMPGGVFEVRLKRLDGSHAGASGIDDIEFLISANPGQAPQPLSQVASGGELSRMSLAIQVIASDGSQIPTMIFDEVDSGVGGGVAEMVGRRLEGLGRSRQVLCVTHLPQVAALASQHFRIAKVTDGKATRTTAELLSEEERVEEIARMLGGVDITKKTLDHAREMLAGATRKRA
ncbi:MAG: DNA repair protein RecN [Pseudomonadota bacterium]